MLRYRRNNMRQNYKIPCRNVTRNNEGEWKYCNNPNCPFVHSLSGLRIDCKFNDCKKENCKYKHKDEDMETYYKRIDKEIPQLPEESQELPKHILERFKTRICTNIKKLQNEWKYCYVKGCNLAHTIDELIIKDCYWGDECRQTNCKYKHKNETNDDVYNRGGIIIPKNLPPSRKELNTTTI